MLMLDKTSERLRSKHVRTLELLQKTLDENVELRDRVSRLQKGALHLGQGEPHSNRTNELEDEIDRLKAEHCAKLLATEEAARVRRDELQRSIDALQTKQQTLQNDVFSLETKLGHAREALQTERIEWHSDRTRLEHETQLLRIELERMANATDTTASDTIGQHDASPEVGSLRRELDAQRQLIDESNARDERLRIEIAALCKELNLQRENHRSQLALAHEQVRELQQRETALTAHLQRAETQVRDLGTTMATLQCEYEAARRLQDHARSQQSDHAEVEQQQQQEQQQREHAAAVAQLQDLEDQNRRLIGENRALHESLGKLQTHHAELTRTHSASGSVFATHIDLKRENFHLRTQVDELKALQRRFLTTATKKTMKFPAI